MKNIISKCTETKTINTINDWLQDAYDFCDPVLNNYQTKNLKKALEKLKQIDELLISVNNKFDFNKQNINSECPNFDAELFKNMILTTINKTQKSITRIQDGFKQHIIDKQIQMKKLIQHSYEILESTTENTKCLISYDCIKQAYQLHKIINNDALFNLEKKINDSQIKKHAITGFKMHELAGMLKPHCRKELQKLK